MQLSALRSPEFASSLIIFTFFSVFAQYEARMDTKNVSTLSNGLEISLK